MTRAQEKTPRTLILFAGQDWWYHSRAHSDFQLMLHASKERRVLSVNSIGMRIPRPGKNRGALRKIARKLGSVSRFLRRPRADLPQFHVLSPVAIPVYGSAVGRQFSKWNIRSQVLAAMKLLRLGKPDIVVTVPTAGPVARSLPHRKIIYNRSDKHSEFKEANTEVIRELELDLLRTADHVIYASPGLLEDELDLVGDRGYLLDHGVDLGLFRADLEHPEPSDLAEIPHPRVGFVGNLRPHLVDIPLLESAARSLPDHQFVFVGDVQDRTLGLLREPNVHLLGMKEHAEVPHYVAHLDVALLPYLRNEWIRHSNPIKLKEYLALGAAVVSTDFPAARLYEEHLRIAGDTEEFIEACREAARRPKTAPVDFSHATWQARADELLRLIG